MALLVGDKPMRRYRRRRPIRRRRFRSGVRALRIGTRM